MKTKILQVGFLAFVAGVMLMFSTCSKDDKIINDVNSSEAVLKSGAGPSAIGMGIYDNAWGGKSHISFQAITKQDGSVQGSGELKHYLTPDDYYVKFTIECLTVDGNEAIMEGFATESTFPLISVGDRVLLKAKDNGEGGSDPDQYTGVWAEGLDGWSDDWDCDDFPAPYIVSIEQGNFQVNP